jgi:histidinol-phosphatase (PHP family)
MSENAKHKVSDRMFADYHVHTHYSEDSEYQMEQVVLDAIEKGLNEICFTDHVDYGIVPENEVIIDGEKFNGKWQDYFQEIEHLKVKYQDQITIKSGMELGLQRHTIQQNNELVKQWDMDFAILSIHGIDNKEFFSYEFQEGKTQEEWNLAYYDELYEVMKNFDHYSVLGHVDLIKRYDSLQGHPDFAFEKTKPIMTKILKHVIENGKGIELNASSFRYGMKDLMPARNILKLYRELGGTIITLGSDSHQFEHLTAYLEECRQELKKIGYTHFCTFDKMKPIFHQL